MMKCKTLIGIAASLVLTVGAITNAVAALSEVKVALQYGIGYLPLTVMKHNKLIEKHLKQEGLKDTKVVWSRLANGAAMNDALLSGSLHFAAGGVGPLLIMWDKTHGHKDVKGIAALCSMPMFINTNDPKVKSIKDLTDKDRIAIAGAGSSIETVVLWMAAAKIYGQDNYRHFDPIMVNLPHPAGMDALLSKHTVTAQFTSPPYQYMELEHPGIHTILNSYDITGTATFLTTWTTSAMRKDNPKVYKAFYDAQKEATEFINHNKKKSAEIYVEDLHSKMKPEFILKMLNDPQIHITMTPQAVKKAADFMQKIGVIKHDPKSWKDVYFPDVHDLKGS
ncbi:MAG TPA: ABC transporter substrate-binding protein [Burkholderiales bacterium]|jgi:NitT/TauT family transport system substrate-binding protein|nr:ABC transporter substrate-binding protein [Burkholderiales bacterium]